MFLILAGVMFAIFSLNVAMGSFAHAAFLGDVGEMLLLFATSIVFVVAILKSETARRNNNKRTCVGQSPEFHEAGWIGRFHRRDGGWCGGLVVVIRGSGTDRQ